MPTSTFRMDASGLFSESVVDRESGGSTDHENQEIRFNKAKKNKPSNIHDVKGSINKVFFYKSGVLAKEYDFSSNPVDAKTKMENWIGYILSREDLWTINLVNVDAQGVLQMVCMNLVGNIKFHIV